MFIETYYDETRPGFDDTGERLIPYPELVGQKLAAWRQYLPIKHTFGIYSLELGVPGIVGPETLARNSTIRSGRNMGPQRP